MTFSQDALDLYRSHEINTLSEEYDRALDRGDVAAADRLRLEIALLIKGSLTPGDRRYA